jgi:hypothetical protein
MVDFHLWPFYERVPAVNEIFGFDILPTASLPRLHAWIAAMETVDAVKQCRTPNELLRRFLVSYQAGEPQYDFDVESAASAQS